MGIGEWRWWTGNGLGQSYENESPDHFRVRPLALSVQKEELSKLMQQAASVGGQTASSEVASRHHYESAANRPVSKHRKLNTRPLRKNRSLQAADNGTVLRPIRSANGVSTDKVEWRKLYKHSLTNIQDHIYAVAGAVAMMDSIEHKMLEMKCEIERINDNGRHVDCDKVVLALQLLADHVNEAIRSVDGQCINLLKDAKMEIRFAELGVGDDKSKGVSLTMISITKFLDSKIKNALANGLVEDELPQFIQEICAIISSNIQILTSVMLALFATRDYTEAVTKHAVHENIISTIAMRTEAQIPLSNANPTPRKNITPDIDEGRRQLKGGRTSLTELLEHVRGDRNSSETPFSNK